MKKSKRNTKLNPCLYEDLIKSENLDPYKALIESSKVLKQTNKYIE